MKAWKQEHVCNVTRAERRLMPSEQGAGIQV